MPRPIITIDEEKCNGCGQCILDCAEGALAIVNGKAKLISEVYCDGLGACLNCPQGALTLAMKDAPPFDEAAALAAKREREAKKPLTPIMPQDFKPPCVNAEVSTWPIQLELVPKTAAFLKNAPLLLAAQCAGFAAPDIHVQMRGKVLLIACPKLENHEILAEKLAAIISANDTPSISILRMSVPCCALPAIVERAIAISGKKPELHVEVVSLK